VPDHLFGLVVRPLLPGDTDACGPGG